MGVPIDYEKALYWFTKAAENGDSGAMNNMGVMYSKGEGSPKDMKKAFDCFLSAAKNGLNRSMYNVGGLYLEGIAVKQDAEKGIHWLKQAAQHGFGHAEVELQNAMHVLDFEKKKFKAFNVEVFEKRFGLKSKDMTIAERIYRLEEFNAKQGIFYSNIFN